MNTPLSEAKLVIMAAEFDRRQAEITNLRSINSALLEALEDMVQACEKLGWTASDLSKARAALKKAKP